MTYATVSEAENPGVPWWLVLIQGIAAIILGVLLIVRPAATTIILIQFLGIYWLISGIFSLISLFWDRSEWGWKLFSGILGIIAGLLIIQNPLWSTLLVPATLAWVLGFTGIFIGIIQIIQAFRGAGWGVGILGGLSILLGILLIARPVIAGLTLPFVLGGLLVVGGLLAIVIAFALRSAAPQVTATASQPSSMAAAPAAAAAVSEPAAPAAEAEVEEAAVIEEEVSFEAAGAAAVGAAAVAAVSIEDTEETVEGTEEETVEVVEEVVVVAETDLTGNVDPADPEEMAKFKYTLDYVEGIGPVYGEQLKAIGLVTCLDLLKAGASRKGREEVAEKSGISHKLVLKWVNHVDLYRIKGVGSEYADLLEASGVDTVMELAQRNPGNLFEKMNEVNAEKELVRKLPTAAQVEDWVSQAKDLPRVVTY